MVCTESITRNPCCDTNSQGARDGVLGVGTVYTRTLKHTISEGLRACSVVKGRRFALVCSLPCSSPCVQRVRAGFPWACTEKKETFQRRQNLPGSALGFLPNWKAGWEISRACYALLASQCSIPQRGTFPSGT